MHIHICIYICMHTTQIPSSSAIFGWWNSSLKRIRALLIEYSASLIGMQGSLHGAPAACAIWTEYRALSTEYRALLIDIQGSFDRNTGLFWYQYRALLIEIQGSFHGAPAACASRKYQAVVILQVGGALWPNTGLFIKMQNSSCGVRDSQIPSSGNFQSR